MLFENLRLALPLIDLTVLVDNSGCYAESDTAIDGLRHYLFGSPAAMPRLRHCLDEGLAVMLAGAMHLPGPDGLISRRRSAGHTITTIMLPAQASAG